ncbi:MAG: decarboxylase [Halieaceae bacterium]|jgi:glutamate/tyrosine decarboxylase-like PLP-dependent enzyme|nr:decarboxylase [Halieaceae bacterium]MBT6333356.1 decarboxylase [Halieaceae bacterium]
MTDGSKSTLFIGPKGEQGRIFSSLWDHLFSVTMQRRSQRFANDSEWHPLATTAHDSDHATVLSALEELLGLLREEIPTFSPRYLGHMVSDVSIPALLGHMAMLFENANLASREAAVVGSALETEAINLLANMVGLDPKPARGHFTSGGTLANFEAVWRARYRLDHWLALGVWLKVNGHSNAPLFDWAHCGWSVYHEQMKCHDLSEPDLLPYSSVVMGALAMSRFAREHFEEEWPEPVLLVPGNKHYSWPKAANIFGLGREAVWSCDLDEKGRLSPDALKAQIGRAEVDGRPIMMVVSVAGTTELGMIDPVDKVADLLDELCEHRGLHIWHHIDAAYGGYFCSVLKGDASSLSAASEAALRAFPRASSLTLDPHKLGFVPYACGAFLVPDANAYLVSNIHAPYLEEIADAKFPSWSTTLEGSRAATGPSAVWLSAKIMPLDSHGHGWFLNKSLSITHMLYDVISRVSPNIRMLDSSDTNVMCFAIAAEGDSLREANRKTDVVIAHFRESSELSATRTGLTVENYGQLVTRTVAGWDGVLDSDQLTVVRMVVMNPYLDNEAIVQNIKTQLADSLRSALN